MYRSFLRAADRLRAPPLLSPLTLFTCPLPGHHFSRPGPCSSGSASLDPCLRPYIFSIICADAFSPECRGYPAPRRELNLCFVPPSWPCVISTSQAGSVRGCPLIDRIFVRTLSVSYVMDFFGSLTSLDPTSLSYRCCTFFMTLRRAHPLIATDRLFSDSSSFSSHLFFDLFPLTTIRLNLSLPLLPRSFPPPVRFSRHCRPQ